MSASTTNPKSTPGATPNPTNAPQGTAPVAPTNVPAPATNPNAQAPFILTSDQMVPVSVSFVDDHGNPVTNTQVTWSSSDTTILSVVASSDAMSAMVSAIGPDGMAQIAVTDAVSGIGGQAAFSVVSGVAAYAVITTGSAVAQPTNP